MRRSGSEDDGVVTDQVPPDPARARIGVLGAGYVGLTTAVCLAGQGHDVVCADIDPAKIEALVSGRPTHYEAGLPALLADGLASGNLRFTTRSSEAVRGAAFVFLCVPTPGLPDGSVDMSFLEAACREIAPHLDPGAVVLNKSTAPVGTAALVEQLLQRPDVSAVSCPEFLREGSAIADTVRPSRVVIGATDTGVADRVASLYRDSGAAIILTDPATAELVKYAANAFLAMRVGFVNATAALCEAVGADVDDLLGAIGADPRIGSAYLRPGPGWGGSCLPKDTQSLAELARRAGVPFGLLDETIAGNEVQIEAVTAKVRGELGSVPGSVIGAWGLTFKAGTDDRRSSPAVEILRRLVGEGATVRAFDPTVSPGPLAELPSVAAAADPYGAAEGAEVLVILTEWEQFGAPDLAKLEEVMARACIVDARNLLDPTAVRAAGFRYVGLGGR